MQIANAKNELLSRMNQIISEWRIQPLTVKIFGSAARNEMRANSDIDLFIVMPDSATGDDVEDSVRPASIFSSILEEGIDIAGDPS